MSFEAKLKISLGLVSNAIKTVTSPLLFKKEIKLWTTFKCPCRLCKIYISNVSTVNCSNKVSLLFIILQVRIFFNIDCNIDFAVIFYFIYRGSLIMDDYPVFLVFFALISHFVQLVHHELYQNQSGIN